MAWIVYELVNPELKEAFATLAEEPLGAELTQNRKNPPAAIAHWPLEFRRDAVVLEAFRDCAEAERYLADYSPRAGFTAVWPAPHRGGRGSVGSGDRA